VGNAEEKQGEVDGEIGEEQERVKSRNDLLDAG